MLTRDPANVDALRLLAGIAMRAKQWSDAEVLLERALEIAPGFLPVLDGPRAGVPGAGSNRRRADRRSSARVAAASRIVPIRMQRSVRRTAWPGVTKRPSSTFKRRWNCDKTHAVALAGLGHVLKTIGRVEEGIAAYRECVQHNSWNGEAWWSLANLKTFRFEPEDVAAMEAELTDERLADEQRANFQFALGKAYEDAGDYARAFDYYRDGNENRRQRETYDPVQTADSHDQFIARSTASCSTGTRVAATRVTRQSLSSACRVPDRH